ncbi:transposase [Nonomuraea muscovyensis]|uniref:transposase n=1 Tax=Nonomuraea muscovyensis TaxID=1124761 RepID=UPI0033DB1822
MARVSLRAWVLRARSAEGPHGPKPRPRWITAHSDKQGASATFKKGYGFHPLACWCADISEWLAMLLRTGSAGSNTVADHVRVLTEAIAQIPDTWRARLWIRIDGAGAAHDPVEHMKGLNTTRRTVRFTVGWKITDVDEAAIAALPTGAWQAAVRQERPSAPARPGRRTGRLGSARHHLGRPVADAPGVLAASLAADLDAWIRLLGLHDDAEPARVESQTLRYCLWHLPARLICHARQRTLKISATWPWKTAFLTCWRRLCALPAPP